MIALNRYVDTGLGMVPKGVMTTFAPFRKGGWGIPTTVWDDLAIQVKVFPEHQTWRGSERPSPDLSAAALLQNDMPSA